MSTNIFMTHLIGFQAHCHLFCVQNFIDSIRNCKVDSNTSKVLNEVCQLYGVHGILENLGEFMQVQLNHYIINKIFGIDGI